MDENRAPPPIRVKILLNGLNLMENNFSIPPFDKNLYWMLGVCMGG